jgi:hypothetical protein
MFFLTFLELQERKLPAFQIGGQIILESEKKERTANALMLLPLG